MIERAKKRWPDRPDPFDRVEVIALYLQDAIDAIERYARVMWRSNFR